MQKRKLYTNINRKLHATKKLTINYGYYIDIIYGEISKSEICVTQYNKPSIQTQNKNWVDVKDH